MRSNNSTLDGAILQTINGRNPAFLDGTTRGVDGIKEFKIITSNFAAEYGLTMGSQMVIVSKAGTNQSHGDGNTLNHPNFGPASGIAFGGGPGSVNPVLGETLGNGGINQDSTDHSTADPVRAEDHFLRTVVVVTDYESANRCPPPKSDGNRQEPPALDRFHRRARA